MFTLIEIFIVLSSILAILFLRQYYNNPSAIFNVYQQPNGFYWIKVTFMYLILSLRKAKPKKARDQCREYIQFEKPQELSEHQKAIDAVYFNGANEQGDHLVVGTARRKANLLDGFLYLKLHNIGLLETLKLPGTALEQQSEEIGEYSAEGVKIAVVEPMKAWKLKFDGQLREHGNINIHDVKIDADWVSDLPCFNFDHHMDPLTMAKSMAYEKFNRDYFKNLESNHQTHYEQHGKLTGIATIDGTKHNLNLDTVRDHSFGKKREWRNFWRYGLHFLSTENGDRITVGKICLPVSFSRLTMGYVYSKSDNKIYPVNSCDLELYQHGEDGYPPVDYAFSFSAGGKNYTMEVMVVDSPHFYISKDWESKVVERLCKFRVNGKRGWGAAEWQYRNIAGKNVQE